MRRLLTALGFLTIIPVPWRMANTSDTDGKLLGRSMAVFPLIGLLLGAMLVGVDWVLTPLISERLVNILLIALLAFITGGLHIDGFMDTVDGIAGSRSKPKILEIMRDSRAGAMGAAAVVLLIIIKWEALNSLSGVAKFNALLLMPMVGRYAMAELAYMSPYARKTEGIGRPFTDGLTMTALIFGFITAFIAAFIFGAITGVITLLAAALVVFVWSIYFKRKLGGITGDVLGALNETTEVLVLILFLMVPPL